MTTNDTTPGEVRSSEGLGGRGDEAMHWVPVTQRVPDDRRRVLAWGERGMLGATFQSSGFLGETRFNFSKSGGQFDAERATLMGWVRVTHWCEIVGPLQGA